MNLFQEERKNLEKSTSRLKGDLKENSKLKPKYSLSLHLTAEMNNYLADEHNFMLAEEIYLQSEKMFLDEEDLLLAKYGTEASVDQLKMYLYRKKMFQQRMKAFVSTRKKMLLNRNELGLKHVSHDTGFSAIGKSASTISLALSDDE